MSRLPRDPEVEAIVAAYRADLAANGHYAKHPVTSPARAFLVRVGVEGWSQMSLAEQLALPGRDRRFVTWLIVSCRLQPTPGYLMLSRLASGQVAAWVHRDFHERFMTTAAELGFVSKTAELQWVSEKVEALYDAPKELPASSEGAEMRKLRSEMHRRMLGNGYCARPVGLDCHFESICESCTYFQTTLEFRPILERQRDDAATKGQVGREKIFDGVPQRLDTQAKAS